MRNHTTPTVYELISQQGKNPSITPGATPQSIQFLMNNLPTANNGDLWNYVTSIDLELKFVVDQPASDGTAITADQLYQCVQSVMVQSPILGQLYTHQNTRGATLGNIIQYVGMGYNCAPQAKVIPATNGDTSIVLNIRIPFSNEYLIKPHETSPWTGFLEGGTVEVIIDVNTTIGAVSAGAVIKAPSSIRCVMNMIPSPEAVIHTPFHWREHQTPGNSTKQIIQDMGSADGLQGIDGSKGVGVAHLLYLMNPTGLGLAGSTTADNIVSYDIPWRNQQRVDCPFIPFAELITQVGNNRKANFDSAAAAFGNGGNGGYPYSFAGAVQGSLNDASAMFFPIVHAARDQETSKFQTLAGAKEMNYTFGSGGTPSGINRYLGQYFPVFTEAFMQQLAARIAPNASGQLVAKTLQKQAGGIHGVGKLAYTRAKVVLPEK